MVTSFDPNLLLSIYNNRLGLNGGGASSLLSDPVKKVAPTAPWSSIPSQEQAAANASAALKSVLAGRKFIDENAAQLDLPSASQDYRKLFALYQGLATLGDLAARAQKKGLTSLETQRLQGTFAKGMTEVAAYVRAAELEKLRLTTGDVASTAKTTAPVQATKSEYVTAPLYAGTSADAVPAFAGNVTFQIGVTRSGAYGPTASPVLFLSHGYPAEVLVLDGTAHLVRRRDTVDDLLGKQYLVPDLDTTAILRTEAVTEGTAR